MTVICRYLLRAIQKGRYAMAFDSTSIGKNIKLYRNKKGISQEELANSVFVSNIHISYVETGAKVPSLELLILIANALDVSADDLLVDNLTHTSSSVGKELHAILQDCNPYQKEMLIRVLKFMKELFTEYRI